MSLFLNIKTLTWLSQIASRAHELTAIRLHLQSTIPTNEKKTLKSVILLVGSGQTKPRSLFFNFSHFFTIIYYFQKSTSFLVKNEE